MRIGVLARGLSVPLGGVTTFLHHVLPRLPVLDPENRYVVFHNSEAYRGRFTGAEEVFFKAPGTFLWENAWFPIMLRRHRVDVLLCTKNLVPAFIPRNIATAVVVYDLLYFPIKGTYIHEYKLADVLYFRWRFPPGARRADRLIAISESTKKDLVSCFGLDPSKVTAVPLGVEAPPPDALSDERLEEVRRRYGLARPYVFYSGSLSPRKNMVRLVQAFARLKDVIPHDLVVTAGKSWKDRPVFDAVRKLGLRTRFRKLGNVPAEDMPALYRMADAFVYVSLYEGFGLPILEAMACGCPVLTSRTSSMPEVAGDAALTVDPADVGEIESGLRRILTDPALVSELRARGARQAAHFTWDRTTRGVIGVLNDLASSKRPAGVLC